MAIILIRTKNVFYIKENLNKTAVRLFYFWKNLNLHVKIHIEDDKSPIL